MINSVSANSFLRQNLPIAAIGAESTPFSKALAAASSASSATSATPVVTISADAKNKAAAGTMPYDQDYAASLSQDQYKAYLSEGAKHVSQIQGLPEGKYDLSRLSSSQAMFVLNDATVNKGATAEDGLVLRNYIADNVSYSGTKSIFSDVPKDIISHALTTKVSIPGVDNGEFLTPKASLQWLLEMQGSELSAQQNNTLKSLFEDRLTGLSGVS